MSATVPRTVPGRSRVSRRISPCGRRPLRRSSNPSEPTRATAPDQHDLAQVGLGQSQDQGDGGRDHGEAADAAHSM